MVYIILKNNNSNNNKTLNFYSNTRACLKFQSTMLEEENKFKRNIQIRVKS